VSGEAANDPALPGPALPDAAPSDAAPSSLAQPGAAPAGWTEVRAWLTAHPEPLRADPDLLRTLGLKAAAANVVEFGPAALARIEAAWARESSARQAIEALAHANYTAQTQAHDCIVDLLQARNNADLARRMDEAAQARFGLVGGAIAVEGFGAPAGWRGLRQGLVDLLLGPADVRMGPPVAREELFGPAGAQVRSVALVRLRLFEPVRPGLLAFGSPEPEGFTREMGAELVSFLGRVVERTAERWPVL